jgi:hypothetical protein
MFNRGETATDVPPRKVSCGNFVKQRWDGQCTIANTLSPGGHCLPCFGIRGSATPGTCDPTCCRSKATDVDGNRPAMEKVEVRGWITNFDGFEDDGNEFVFYVRLDLDWQKSPCAAPGITAINSLDALSLATSPYNLGPLAGSNVRGAALGGPVSLKVEINDWEMRSPPGWNGVWQPNANPPHCAVSTPSVPAGWQTFDRHAGERGFAPGNHWIFDPTGPGTPADPDLKAGDYVRLVGTLWEDEPHNKSDCWAEGATHAGISFDGHNFGRGWFEIHGVDFMAVLSHVDAPADAPPVAPRPPEKAGTFSVLTLCNGAQVTDWEISAPGGGPPPKSPDAKVDYDIRGVRDFTAGPGESVSVNAFTNQNGFNGIRVTAVAPNFTDAAGTMHYGKSMSLFRVFWKIPPPTVTNVTPSSIPVGTDTRITIMGKDFIDVQGIFPASDFQVDDPATSISAHILGSLAAGCYNIEVRTPAGNSSPSNMSQFCVTPIVKDINPMTGPYTGGTQVTVDGAGLSVPGVGIPTAARFLVGGNDAGVGTCSTASCTFLTPRGTPGVLADVRACVNGACSATSDADKFAYLGPTIASFSPSHGPISGGTWVEIDGAGLPHDGRVQILFGDVQALQLDGCPPVSSSDTCIRALSPPHGAGQVPITVSVVGSAAPPPAAGLFTYDAQARLTAFGYDQGRLDPGWVTLNGAAPGPNGAAVSIMSSDPAALQPTTVNVPVGASGATFTLNFLPVPRTETVTLTASYAGSSLTTTVMLNAPPPRPPISIGLDADELAKGQWATAIVTLSSPAGPGGATIDLRSSDSSAVPVPSNVTVQPANATGMFRFTNNYSGRPKQVSITATYAGASASSSLYVPTLPPPPNGCSHCRTPEQCCVCNGGTFSGGRCQ